MLDGSFDDIVKKGKTTLSQIYRLADPSKPLHHMTKAGYCFTMADKDVDVLQALITMDKFETAAMKWSGSIRSCGIANTSSATRFGKLYWICPRITLYQQCMDQTCSDPGARGCSAREMKAKECEDKRESHKGKNEEAMSRKFGNLMWYCN